MHTHDDNPCWDAHCAPHLTHHDAGVRELIARAEARGAERERERITDALEALPRAQDEVDDGWVRWGAICALLAEHRRDERPAPELPKWADLFGAAPGINLCGEPDDVTEDDVARVLYDNSGESYAECEDAARALLAAFHVTRREATR